MAKGILFSLVSLNSRILITHNPIMLSSVLTKIEVGEHITIQTGSCR